MMAITIWQPWASLILAGARAMNREDLSALIYELVSGIDNHSLIPKIALPILERAHTVPGCLLRSSILYTAILGEPIRAVDWAKQRRPGRDREDISETAWGWPLTRIEALERMVPASGAQGFWAWNPA